MTLAQLQEAYEQAIAAYPDRYISEHSTVSIPSIDDSFPAEEAEVPHTWQLVDACAASFRTPQREGMLVLREDRPGSRYESHHWGFMIAKSEVIAQQQAN